MRSCRFVASIVAALVITPRAVATERARIDARVDEVIQRYDVSGEGVLLAILDRGIDWTHPDFLTPEGTTRIKAMLDLTGGNGCPGIPGVEYSAADINAALAGTGSVAMGDAVGHGTVTAGVAAGDGSAHPTARYRGIAPDADLLIVKVVSEGAPPHSGQPGETAFQACLLTALDWVDAKATEFDQPCVGLINSGTQWGPMDGTSVVSRKIDEVFGMDRAGRVYVAPSGDEGSFPTHARSDYTASEPAEIAFTAFGGSSAFLTAYYSGAAPASVSIVFSDGEVVGPVDPGDSSFTSSASIINYTPGSEFYPWTSDSGDRGVWVRIDRLGVSGRVVVTPTTGAGGTVDVYHGQLPNVLRFTSDLAPGRLTDYATTTSALVVGAHVARASWTDINGIARSNVSEGATGDLWVNSAGGPTRDGRTPGVHLTAPGHNIFAAYGSDSYYAQFNSNLIQDGGGLYGRLQATSGAAPIAAGAAALLLEFDPTLTARQVTDLLTSTARQDGDTGGVPNERWGAGKLDLMAAFEAIAPCPGDLTGDGDVGSVDLAVLIASWGSGGGDVTGDGTTDSADLATLIAGWGECVRPMKIAG